MVTMHDVLDAQWMLDNAKDGGCPVLGGLHAVGALCWGTACGGCPVLGDCMRWVPCDGGDCMRWVPCAGGDCMRWTVVCTYHLRPWSVVRKS